MAFLLYGFLFGTSPRDVRICKGVPCRLEHGTYLVVGRVGCTERFHFFRRKAGCVVEPSRFFNDTELSVGSRLILIKKIPSFTSTSFDGAQERSSVISVSYTHLRAHETDSYLVCRLLLAK